jgi:Xaa-Pro aminopeptidase
VKNGEFVLMDFGAVYNGYHSDMTRTVCVGEPDEEMVKIYNIVLEAQQAAIEAAKAGITGAELDAVARRHICDAGYGEYFGHSLGHGVGLDVHEAPRAARSAAPDELLSRGHVVTVEPGIYVEGKYGCRIEDMVLITENGIMNFTKSPKELIEIY